MRFLQGRTAIITGGGRGIGRAVARAYSEAGAAVVITARTRREVEETVRDIVARGASALAMPGDVSDEDTPGRVVQAALDTYGRLDILVNAAGINGPVAAVEDIAPAEWERVFRINVSGTFLFCRAAIPLMRRQKSGSILNVASGLVRRVQPGQAAYSAAKAAIAHFSSVLAAELAEDAIRVNAIHPGIVKTRLLNELLSLDPSGVTGKVVGRLRSVEQAGQLTTLEQSSRLFLMMVSPVAADLSGRFIAAEDAAIAEHMKRFTETYGKA